MQRVNSLSDGMTQFATNSQVMENSNGQEATANSGIQNMNSSKHALLNLVQDPKLTSSGSKKQGLNVNIGSTLKGKAYQRDLIKVSSKSSFNASSMVKATPVSTKAMSIVLT